jgi:YVTN family beta-propeller protein
MRTARRVPVTAHHAAAVHVGRSRGQRAGAATGTVALAAALAAALALVPVIGGVASWAAPPKAATVYAYVSSNLGITPIDTATNKEKASIAGTSAPIAFSPNGKESFVNALGGVGVINTATNKLVRTIATILTGEPLHSAITPNGKTLYLLNYEGDSVTPVPTGATKADTPIPVGDQPFSAAITPNGKTLFVANENSWTVSEINTATNKVEKTFSYGTNHVPYGIVITPNGKTAYVLVVPEGYVDGRVTPITVATGKAGTPITVGEVPWTGAFTPNGKELFVENAFSDSVSVINPATNKVVHTIAVGDVSTHQEAPEAMVMSPNGKAVWVAFSSFDSDAVQPINVSTDTAGKLVTVVTAPHFIAITPNGKTLYVASTTDSVIPVNTATDTAEAAITVGSQVEGIAVMPDPLAITTASLPKATVGKHYHVTLGATGGQSPYVWSRAKGSLPKGLSVSKAGVVSGKPTKKGKATFTLSVKDATGTSVKKAFTLTVS